MWLTFESGGLVLLVYIDLVVVSLEMVFVIRDATLHSVSLMEEIVDLKDDELSAPQCCSMCVLPICMQPLPAECSLIDTNQGYTGGIEWEEE